MVMGLITFLLHVGLITFRFGYGRDRKYFIFMISGFLDVSLSPKTYIIYIIYLMSGLLAKLDFESTEIAHVPGT